MASRGGYSDIEKVLMPARKYMAIGGLIAVEIGVKQEYNSRLIAQYAGLTHCQIIPDLSGRGRVLLAFNERDLL